MHKDDDTPELLLLNWAWRCSILLEKKKKKGLQAQIHLNHLLIAGFFHYLIIYNIL